MKLFHLKDDSETSTRADRQNASDVWPPSDLFFTFSFSFQMRLHISIGGRVRPSEQEGKEGEELVKQEEEGEEEG